MANISLVATPVDLVSPVFAAIKQWKFDGKFEDEFVARVLADDIPQRVKYQNCRIWAYVDPDKTIVGFGTLSICDDYTALTDAKPHTYIPLLAVHPDRRGLGHGRSVVEHLIREAACLVQANSQILHPALFLDVYEESVAAFSLYGKCGFQALGRSAFVDPLNGKKYCVMAKRLLP